MTTRAALYLRVSLDHTGEGLAVSRQREDCRRIAAERGWTVVEEYVDNSISASDARKARPGYDRLVADHDAGRFDALVCWDLDRLTRQPRQLEDWIDRAAERGLLLVTANGEADLSTDGGRLFARIKASVARAEVERKSARQVRAAQQRSDMGMPPMGVRLTGYTVGGEVIESEAVVVRDVFTRFAAGDSLRALAASLGEAGVPTRHGKPWHPSSVRTMLTNPRYAGRAIYRGETTGRLGGWEPLVSEATFEIVQARLSDPRRRTQHGTDRKHLGSGLYRCAECDTPLRAWSGGRYRCWDGHVNRTQRQVDDFVLDVVRARLARPDVADLLPTPTDGQSREVTDEIARLRDRLAVIEADYDAGLIDGRRFAAASEKVGAELSAAEARLGRLSSGHGALGLLSASDPVAAFDAAPLMLRRAALDALLVVRLRRGVRGRKTFDPESVEITWRTA